MSMLRDFNFFNQKKVVYAQNILNCYFLILYLLVPLQPNLGNRYIVNLNIRLVIWQS